MLLITELYNFNAKSKIRNKELLIQLKPSTTRKIIPTIINKKKKSDLLMTIDRVIEI